MAGVARHRCTSQMSLHKSRCPRFDFRLLPPSLLSTSPQNMVCAAKCRCTSQVTPSRTNQVFLHNPDANTRQTSQVRSMATAGISLLSTSPQNVLCAAKCCCTNLHLKTSKNFFHADVLILQCIDSAKYVFRAIKFKLC